ncbi:hypothetical protein T484DRAFT_1864633, partial [Baffinella frigidus]
MQGNVSDDALDDEAENATLSARTNTPSTGSVSITLSGAGFGLAPYTAAARLGSTSCEASEWASDSSLRCRSVAGAGATLRVAVTAGGRAGTATEGVSYDLPTVSTYGSHVLDVSEYGWNVTSIDTTAGNLPPAGDVDLVLWGAGFGTLDWCASGRIGVTAFEASLWISDSALVAKVATGLYFSRTITVTQGIGSTSLTEALSYNAHELTNLSIGSENRPTFADDTELITVLGKGFSGSDYSVEVTVGVTACEQSEWVSEVSVLCKGASGVASTHTFEVTLGNRLALLSSAVSYDIPALYLPANFSDAKSATNMIPTGGMVLSISGGNLGSAGYTVKPRVGATVCEASEWESDSALACKTPGGVFATRRLAVTAGVRVGTLTEALSYDVPMLGGGLDLNETTDKNARTFSRTNMPSTGSASVTVVGSGLGRSDYTGASRIGSTACEASEWESDSSMRCLSSGGVFGTLRVAVTAAARAGSVTEGLSYDSPALVGGQNATALAHNEDAANATLTPGNIPSMGAISITVVGSGLGVADYSAAARFGDTGCEASEWVSDSSIMCLAPKGLMMTVRLAITAGVHAGSVTEAVSYDAAVISSITNRNSTTGEMGGPDGVQGNANLLPKGGIELVLYGQGIGLEDYTAAARTGLEGCESSEWVSDSSLFCKTGFGLGGSTSVAITAGVRVDTMTAVLSYNSPVLSGGGNATTFGRSNSPSTGSVSMTIVGAGFAINDYSQRSRVGGTACEATSWESDNSMRCLSSGGVFGTLRVAVTAGVSVGTVTESLLYDVPMLSITTRANRAGGGSASVTVQGSGLGHSDYTGESRVGATACEASEWESDSSLRCLSSGGVFGTLSVAVTAGIRAGSVTEGLSYDVPMLAGGLNLT